MYCRDRFYMAEKSCKNCWKYNRMRISLPIFKSREIMTLSRVCVYTCINIYCLFKVQENLDYYQIRGERDISYMNNKKPDRKILRMWGLKDT